MQNIYRAAAVLACLALAAGTPGGLRPGRAAGQQQRPRQTEEGAASPLHDGRLRYLYNLNGQRRGHNRYTYSFSACPMGSFQLLGRSGCLARLARGEKILQFSFGRGIPLPKKDRCNLRYCSMYRPGGRYLYCRASRL